MYGGMHPTMSVGPPVVYDEMLDRQHQGADNDFTLPCGCVGVWATPRRSTAGPSSLFPPLRPFKGVPMFAYLGLGSQPAKVQTISADRVTLVANFSSSPGSHMAVIQGVAAIGMRLHAVHSQAQETFETTSVIPPTYRRRIARPCVTSRRNLPVNHAA
jgi:hypothetical protein